MTEGRMEKLLPKARWLLGIAAAVAHAIGRFVRALFQLQLLRSAVRMSIVAVGLALVALLVHATCFLAVPHGFVGVKQNDVGERGIDERDFPPGFVPRMPFAESGHLIDARVHVLTFGGPPSAAAPWLEVRMKEGDIVQVGTSVAFRVRKGEAWARSSHRDRSYPNARRPGAARARKFTASRFP